jgi:valyl-tRNA synthetase
MYQALVRPVESDAPLSVHMLSWPSSNPKLINPELRQEMEWVSEIVDTAQYIRQEEGLKLRWPCQRLIIVPSKKEFQLGHFSDVVASQTNVKTVEILKQAKGEDLKEKELSFAKIYLDISETPELRAERLSRDVIRQIQATRKKAGLHVIQRIELFVATPSKDLRQALKDTSDAISSKVGASELNISESLPDIKGAAKGKLNFAQEEINFVFTAQEE